MNSQSQEEKKTRKGFWKGLLEKIDKALREKSASGSSCCAPSDKKGSDKSSCCGN